MPKINFNFNGENYNTTVDKQTLRLYERYNTNLLFDKTITASLIVGILMYFAFYVYYSIENLHLINKISTSCPTFYCPTVQAGDPCNGRAYYYDTNNKKVCTDN